MVIRYAGRWCGRDLWVESTRSDLPCFAFCKKSTPNERPYERPYELAINWAQVAQKKQQQAQVYVSKIYFYIYAYISTFKQLKWIFHTKSLNR